MGEKRVWLHCVLRTCVVVFWVPECPLLLVSQLLKDTYMSCLKISIVGCESILYSSLAIIKFPICNSCRNRMFVCKVSKILDSFFYIFCHIIFRHARVNVNWCELMNKVFQFGVPDFFFYLLQFPQLTFIHNNSSWTTRNVSWWA